MTKINELVNYDGKTLLLVQKLREIILTDQQIEAVWDIIFNTCRDCWDRPSGCQCENDI